jgi:hypothetical protein
VHEGNCAEQAPGHNIHILTLRRWFEVCNDDSKLVATSVESARQLEKLFEADVVDVPAPMLSEANKSR